MERKKFKYAVIFKEDDTRENLMSCVVSCAEELDEAVIMSENEHGELTPIAEIHNGYCSRELTVMDGWDSDSQMVEMAFNIAEFIRIESDLPYEQCVDIAEAITRKYNIINR